MNQEKISETAIVTASLRALSCYEEDELIKGNDHLAILFLSEEKKVPLASFNCRDKIKKMIPEGLYEYVIARTAYFDDLFLSSLKGGMKQIVLLGAGFDSRPYRFQNEIENTKIFEVDELKTQEYKRMILQSNGVACNKNIQYVPVDLEKDDIIHELCRAGYNSELRSLFIWEGVTFYLYPDTVRSILRSLRSNSAEQSMISFDFQNLDQEQGLINTGLKDEAIHFGIKAETASEYLKDLGYSIIEHIGSEEMVKRYLTCSDGSQIGNIKSMMHIVKAQMT